MSYSERLNAVIPGGAHTYSRGDDQYPSIAPQILARGKGAYVWDGDGNKFLDYGMALRAVTLGYSNERVNNAAIIQINNGVNLTRASVIELEVAEKFIDLIPSAEMVKFAKNGSNVTTGAIKIARAYTGRRYVCFPRQHAFFSFDDWFIGKTLVTRGIPEEHYKYSLLFDYNEVNSLENLFNEYPDDIACIIMEPATMVGPCDPDCNFVCSVDKTCKDCPKNKTNFLQKVREICHKNGALFILDEMITGFRWHIQGAQTWFDVEPDISTFGKGMANGFSVAAIVGKKEFMSVGGIKETGSERVFMLSTTHGAEMTALGAFKETIDIYKEGKVISHLWQYGEKLYNGINNISKENDLLDYVYMDGNYISMNFATKNEKKEISMEFRTLLLQELIKGGVLAPWIAVSVAHGEVELKLTFDAYERALNVYKKALEDGIDKYLVGPAVKPVFRKFN